MYRPEDLEMQFALANSNDMSEQVSYNMWATVVSSAKAFGVVKVKIDPTNCRIYLSVSLRWWAKAKRLEIFRSVWLRRAEDRVKAVIPEGWRFLIYYEHNPNRVSSKDTGPSDAVDSGDAT